MKYWFKGNAFRDWGHGNLNELSEMQYGRDENGYIDYPNVTTCTTLTLLLGDNSLLGVHLDKLASAAEIQTVIQRMNTDRQGRAIRELCLVGALKASFAGGWMTDETYRWPRLFNAFGSAFGFSGAIRGYVQPEGSERHYRVMGGGSTSWLAKAAAVVQVGTTGMTKGGSLSESSGVPWESLTLSNW
jgi:hypothetical protein